jgi:hypothetical protein
LRTAADAGKESAMSFQKTVNTYFSAFYPNEGHQNEQARLNLYCDEGHKLYILFQDPKHPFPPNTYNANSKVGSAYVPSSLYLSYLDLLRSEKPITVTFNPEASPPAFTIFGPNEPVGQDEV